MKKIVMFIIVASASWLLHSCETDADYEITDKMVTINAKFAYMQNQDARYRIDFGQTQLADTLPKIAPTGIILAGEQKYVKENELTQQLKVWRRNPDGTETLELETPITAPAGGSISLLQLSDSSPVVSLKEVHPPEDKPSQTVAQFFYAGANQPDHVKVTVLAVDLVSLAMAGNNVNNVAENKKGTVASFTMSKGELSQIITLDLKQFVAINNNISTFLYRIENPATGAILQDYAGSRKITVPVYSSAQPLNAKYKHILFQWGYQSATIPFQTPVSIINGEAW